jgi:hypothetical protein
LSLAVPGGGTPSSTTAGNNDGRKNNSTIPLLIIEACVINTNNNNATSILMNNNTSTGLSGSLAVIRFTLDASMQSQFVDLMVNNISVNIVVFANSLLLNSSDNTVDSASSFQMLGIDPLQLNGRLVPVFLCLFS